MAQRLFAERGFDAVTIADVATAADVAVQTVFNHFASKEELFFDERTPWVDGPAEAVRTRACGVSPLAALRRFVVEYVRAAVATTNTEERRCYIATLQASPGLRAFELSLLQRAESRLAAALAEAWSQDATFPADLDVRVAASLTAAMWVGAARALLVELRAVHTQEADLATVMTVVESLGEQVFERLENGLGPLLRREAAGPARPVSRAG